MIYPQKIQHVDPVSLATVSGATKIPRFALPTPPVVRPFLLTQQFRGCQCSDCAGMRGMIPPDYGVLRGLGDIYSGDPGTDTTPTTVYTGDPGTTLGPTQFSMQQLQVPSYGSGNVSVLQSAAIGANFIPGIGQIASVALTTISTMLNQFETWFRIGAGRREANVIVPVQNNLVAQLGVITNQILTGDTPSLDQLIGFYRQVWVLGVSFQEFVLMRNFTDRRASGQALNTVMPYIDGTCGYPIPVGATAYPGQSNCLQWGSGTIGGVGTNGMLGAIGRAIVAAGGTVPVYQDLHVAANSGIPGTGLTPGQGGGGYPGGIVTPLPTTIMGISTPLVLLGVVAIFLYSKGTL